MLSPAELHLTSMKDAQWWLCMMMVLALVLSGLLWLHDLPVVCLARSRAACVCSHVAPSQHPSLGCELKCTQYTQYTRYTQYTQYTKL